MKKRERINPPLVRQCQRPFCPNQGRLRLQKRLNTTRYLYLCGVCVETLLPIDVTDLFLQFGQTTPPSTLERP
jgi:hypothetical protein